MDKEPYVNSLNINQRITVEHVAYKVQETEGSFWWKHQVMADNTDPMGPKAHVEKNKGLRVCSALPENIPFTMANEVNEMFDFLKIKSKIIQIGTLGVKRQNWDRGIVERQFWRGIQNQDVSIEMSFNAYYSGHIDVIQPVGKLILMAAPLEKGFLSGVGDSLGTGSFGAANGSALFGSWQAPPRVSIRFGSIIWFSGCLIKSVAVQYGNKLDANFDPLSATANVTFITENPMGYGAFYNQSNYNIPEKGAWEK